MIKEEELKVVCKIAGFLSCKFRHWKFGFMDEEDYFSVAVMKAIREIHKYDSSKGCLYTFLYPRMLGAILDELRSVMHYKRIKKDSVVQVQYRREVSFSDLGCDLETTVSTINPVLIVDIKDELLEWRKVHNVTFREWLLLFCRYGLNLSQRETGKVIGVKNSRVSQCEKKLIEDHSLPRLSDTVNFCPKRSKKIKV